MKSSIAILAVLIALIATPSWAGIIMIESYAHTNSVSVYQAGSLSNEIATSGAIGGYRTLSLTTVGDNEFTTAVLGVSSTTQRISLSTPDGNNATAFSVKWAGQNGAGFTTAQNLLTLPQGMNSELEFSLRSSDQESQLTWSVTDINAKVSSYTVVIPVHPSTSAPLFYELRLSSFSNPVGFDWTNVKAIELSGGGQPEWDFSLTGPIVIGVPEPGSTGLLLISLTLGAARFRRRIST
jgi:hypothetical protein